VWPRWIYNEPAVRVSGVVMLVLLLFLIFFANRPS
jgi:hypothetical protein